MRLCIFQQTALCPFTYKLGTDTLRVQLPQDLGLSAIGELKRYKVLLEAEARIELAISWV